MEDIRYWITFALVAFLIVWGFLERRSILTKKKKEEVHSGKVGFTKYWAEDMVMMNAYKEGLRKAKSDSLDSLGDNSNSSVSCGTGGDDDSKQ